MPGIEVIITRNKQMVSFNSARFDDEHAVVSGKSKPGHWNVRLLEPKGPTQTTPPVPVEFLEAVQPRSPGDDVVILVDPERGRGATTISRDGSDWLVEMKDGGEQKIFESRHIALLAR